MDGTETFGSLDDLLHGLSEDLAWLERYSDLELSTEEQKALVYARKTGRIDNAAYRRLNHTDTLTASRALTRLESLNLLDRSEQRRGPGVYYRLPHGELNTLQTSFQIPLQISPQSTRHSVQELARLLAEGKRVPRTEIDAGIVALCRERPMTARELADVLHRNVKYLTESYLARLVREGRLERTGAAHDPHVAYRTVDESEDKEDGTSV